MRMRTYEDFAKLLGVHPAQIKKCSNFTKASKTRKTKQRDSGYHKKTKRD